MKTGNFKSDYNRNVLISEMKKACKYREIERKLS